MTTTKKIEMPFLEHLRELRVCLIQAFIGIALATTLSYFWSDLIFSILTKPIRDNFKEIALIGTGPAEAFMVKIKAAFICGSILASPYTSLQIWNFIAPGLHENEKKFALPFILSTSIFFILGIAFCYFAVFPFAFQFFRDEYSSINVTANIKIGEYLAFITKLLVVFGLVFEVPIISYLLARMGVLTHTWLIAKMRYAVVAIFVIAGVLTPPDVISQLLLAAPLMIFYAMCIGITYWVGKNKDKN